MYRLYVTSWLSNGAGINGISDDKMHLIGETDVSPLNVVVRLGIQGNDPAVLIDSFWEGLNLVRE